MTSEPENDNSFKSVLKVAIPVIGILFIVYISSIIYEKYHPEPPKEKISTNLNSDTLAETGVDTSELNSANDSLVKNLELGFFADKVNINDALGNIAGVDGSSTWTYNNYPENYKDNPDIFIATNHTTGSSDKEKETFEITILINRSNKRFKILDARENGKRLKGMVLFTSLYIEGGFSQKTR